MTKEIPEAENNARSKIRPSNADQGYLSSPICVASFYEPQRYLSLDNSGRFPARGLAPKTNNQSRAVHASRDVALVGMRNDAE